MNTSGSVNTSFGGFDWGLLTVYMLSVIGIAVWSKLSKKQDTEEYLLARHSMNWMVVATSVFATLFSTISFVSVPGEAYNFGLMMIISSIGIIIFTPLSIWLFLRFFFNAPTFTAYEYLERRFNRKCRMLASILFIAIRLFYTGGVFYAAAIIFESIVGWSPLLTVAVVGAVTIVYAFLGGARAVIINDVIQSGIILVGISALFFRILQLTGFDFVGVFSFAHAHNHTFELLADPSFYRFDIHDRWNFWLLALGLIMGPMTTMSCDQFVIQRLLAGKNYRQAVKSIYTSYFMGCLTVIALYGIGIFLYYYYNAGTGVLPKGIEGDQVLGYFVNTCLPSPLPGLIMSREPTIRVRYLCNFT